MTRNMTNKLFMIHPNRAGELIAKAMRKRKDVVYVPGIWFAIMLLIKFIPEVIFKKLKL